MIVAAHPHRTKYKAGEVKCVSITPRGGRAYYKAYAHLRGVSFRVYQGGVERAQREQVRNVHAWLVGELTGEGDYAIIPDSEFRAFNYEKVLYHYNVGRFMTEAGKDVTDDKFIDAYIIGKDCWVKS